MGKIVGEAPYSLSLNRCSLDVTLLGVSCDVRGGRGLKLGPVQKGGCREFGRRSQICRSLKILPPELPTPTPISPQPLGRFRRKLNPPFGFYHPSIVRTIGAAPPSLPRSFYAAQHSNELPARPLRRPTNRRKVKIRRHHAQATATETTLIYTRA